MTESNKNSSSPQHVNKIIQNGISKSVTAADLAENSPVRGCMIIKPWGYGYLGKYSTST